MGNTSSPRRTARVGGAVAPLAVGVIAGAVTSDFTVRRRAWRRARHRAEIARSTRGCLAAVAAPLIAVNPGGHVRS